MPFFVPLVSVMYCALDPSKLVLADTLNSSTCPSQATNFISENSSVWLSIFVVANVVLVVVTIILTIIICKKSYPGTICHRINLYRSFPCNMEMSEYNDQSSTNNVIDSG